MTIHENIADKFDMKEDATDFFESKRWFIWKNDQIESVTIAEWEKHHRKRGNVIKQSKVGDFFISTVLLPFEHIGGIFETMVFDKDESGDDPGLDDLRMKRTFSHEQALLNHIYMEKLCNRYIRIKTHLTENT